MGWEYSLYIYWEAPVLLLPQPGYAKGYNIVPQGRFHRIPCFYDGTDMGLRAKK